MNAQTKRKMNTFVRNAYERLQIRCIFEGCKDVFAWTEQVKHEAKCAFAWIVCQYCKENIHKNDLASHHKNVCRMYPVLCAIRGCTHKVPRSQMEKHKQEFMAHHVTALSEVVKKQDATIKKQRETIERLESQLESSSSDDDDDEDSESDDDEDEDSDEDSESENSSSDDSTDSSNGIRSEDSRRPVPGAPVASLPNSRNVNAQSLPPPRVAEKRNIANISSSSQPPTRTATTSSSSSSAATSSTQHASKIARR
jgi:hypothetical protein